MPFVPVPSAYQVNLKQMVAGQMVENVIAVRSDDGESPLSMSDIADVFLDWWSTELAPLLSSNITLNEIVVRDLSSESAGSFLLTPATPPAGAGGQAVANNVAFCVSARTAAAGRSFRGRTYVAGLPRDSVSASAVSSGTASDLVAAFNQLRTLLEAINAVIVVISRIHNGIERLTGLATVVVNYTAVDLTVDSQRRRLPGRGT